MNTSPISQGHSIEFQDRYGETRRIHRNKNGMLAVKREKITPCLAMNQVISRMIGQRIKAKRIEAGMTLADLCIKAGLVTTTPKSRMWEIENALRGEGLRMGTVYAIALALGCEAYQLMPSNKEVSNAAGIQEETSVSLGVIAK